MIRFIRIKSKDYVSAIDFHNLLGLSDNHYSRNVKNWLFETDYLFQEEMEIMYPRKDQDYYSPLMESEGKGNFRLRFFDTDGRFKDPKTRRDMIYILDKFGLIKIAVFDFLSAANKPSEVALKVGELAKQMAKRMDVEFRRQNEPDLFKSEIEPINTSMLHRINPYIKEHKKLN